ncbi:ketopantoate hydroxymethyltransferase [bacterium A37T11]|nr:ketopantoate hydroxymethyltransferase [bacterium A37T11]
MSVHNEVKRITTSVIRKMKAEGKKISMLTAYDYSMAKIFDEAGMDIILVGDSAANVMAGYDTTLPITLEQMIYHAASVVRAAKRSMVIADLPFGTYQGSAEKALDSAVRMMKESGVQGVKMEGGIEIEQAIRGIVNAGIPVMGHLGLTPQSINQFGNFGLRAGNETEAHKLHEDCLALQTAGCFGIVLEKIPAKLAKTVTDQLLVPTIGIGAGPHCDGQVLVMHDLLGINKGFKPKFLRLYLNLFDEIQGAVSSYINDVKSGSFPNEEEQY